MSTSALLGNASEHVKDIPGSAAGWGFAESARVEEDRSRNLAE